MICKKVYKYMSQAKMLYIARIFTSVRSIYMEASHVKDYQQRFDVIFGLRKQLEEIVFLLRITSRPMTSVAYSLLPASSR